MTLIGEIEHCSLGITPDLSADSGKHSFNIECQFVARLVFHKLLMPHILLLHFRECHTGIHRQGFR